MIVVTAGSGYLDIDAFACCFAYARMLNYLGKPAVIRTTVLGNETVTPGLLKENFALIPIASESHLPLEIDTEAIYMAPAIEAMAASHIQDMAMHPDACKDLFYAIMDVSEPDYFEPFVQLDQVVTVIDHHVGYGTFWQDRIGEHAKIEFIGAAVTLVYEEIQRNQVASCIDPPLARLMMAAILDNTLNFTAGVTCERDHQVYKALSKIAGCENFPEVYFSQCQDQIEASLLESIRGDMKHLTGEIYPGLPKYMGQLAVWDTDTLLNRQEEIHSFMNSYGKEWMMNLISLKEGKSYLLAEDKQIQKILEERIGGVFHENQMVLDKAILRKEIKKLFAIML